MIKHSQQEHVHTAKIIEYVQLLDVLRLIK